MLPGRIYLLWFVCFVVITLHQNGRKDQTSVTGGGVGGLKASLSDWAPSKAVGTRKKKTDDASF